MVNKFGIHPTNLNLALDIAKPLVNWFINRAELKDLDDLHLYDENYQRRLRKGTDQSTPFHKYVYSSFDNKDLNFEPIYHEFIKNLLGLYGVNDKEVIYQKFPSLRVQYPGNISVFEFHKDSDYAHSIYELIPSYI